MQITNSFENDTTLAADETYTSPALEMITNSNGKILFSQFNLSIITKVPGNLVIQKSEDGSNWENVRSEDDVTGRYYTEFSLDNYISANYTRIKYRNGDTPQEQFAVVGILL